VSNMLGKPVGELTNDELQEEFENARSLRHTLMRNADETTFDDVYRLFLMRFRELEAEIKKRIARIIETRKRRARRETI